MRIIKLFISSLLIFGILLFLISLLFPSTASSERSGSINAPMNVVMEQVSDLKNWHNWNPWSPGFDEKSSLELISMSEPSKGVGAHFEYKNPANGEMGKVTITKSTATELEYGVTFEGRKPMKGIIQIKPTVDQKGTAIRWVLEMHVGLLPWWKIRGFVMDRLYGPYIERGLNHLDKVCSGQ